MGTYSAKEIAESRNHQRVMPGIENTMELTYLVEWTPANSSDTFPNGGDAGIFTASGLPQIRQRLPSAIRGTDPFLKRMVCRTVDASIVREKPYTWLVRCGFGTYFPYQIDNDQWSQITRTSGIRMAPMWRMGATLPSNGDVTWPTGVVDIGGTKVDLNGNPPQYEIPQMQIVFEVFWDRTELAGSPAAAQKEPPTATWSTYIGKRNDGVFLGCDIGTLVYRGFSVAPSHEWYRIQHTFLWDAQFHLEQVPIPKPTGAPLCTTGATVAGLVVLQADKIGFFQKYPSKATFNNIVTAAQLAEINTPIPAAV